MSLTISGCRLLFNDFFSIQNQAMRGNAQREEGLRPDHSSAAGIAGVPGASTQQVILLTKRICLWRIKIILSSSEKVMIAHDIHSAAFLSQ